MRTVCIHPTHAANYSRVVWALAAENARLKELLKEAEDLLIDGWVYTDIDSKRYALGKKIQKALQEEAEEWMK